MQQKNRLPDLMKLIYHLRKVASSMDEESDNIHEANVAPPSMEALL